MEEQPQDRQQVKSFRATARRSWNFFQAALLGSAVVMLGVGVVFFQSHPREFIIIVAGYLVLWLVAYSQLSNRLCCPHCRESLRSLWREIPRITNCPFCGGTLEEPQGPPPPDHPPRDGGP